MPRYGTKIKPKAKPRQNALPFLLALAGVALVAVAAWMIFGSAQPKAELEVKGAPHLKVEKDAIDHGEVKLGTPIRDEVRVTNTGDQPVRFTEAPYIEVLEGC
jgi:hypothetical protein